MQNIVAIGVCMLSLQVKSSSDCHSNIILVKEEQKCLEYLDLLHFNMSTETDCMGMWDNLNCWPSALIGDTVSTPCPEFFNSEGKVHRNCTITGWSDLLVPHEDACGYTFNDTLHFLAEPPETQQYFSYVKTMYTAGYTFSLVALVFSTTILCVFRKLHCTRNYIHIQLFVSFILRAIFIFIKDSMLFTDEEFFHCDFHPVACKMVLLLSNYFILANYSWLLVEGHFLYTLVVCSFFSLRKHLACYVTLGWGLPLAVIFSWGLAKYFYENEGCWETRGFEWIWWILRVPVLLTIFMNLLFFLGILRVLIGKLKLPDAQRSEFSQYKRLIKSTFFLVALFGLQYMLFVFLPVTLSGAIFRIWTFAELALSSTQGFVVSVLYCFMNGEVQQELKRRWRRWRLNRHFGGSVGVRRRRTNRGSISHSSGPALTQVLMLPSVPEVTAPPSGH